MECLARADLVLYDYLVDPRTTRLARPGAELVVLGRHGQGRVWTQAEINARMVAAARQGLIVTRLKGGDPAIFARGQEEIAALESAGIDYEIVPGITAMLAAGSHTGVQITDRDSASAVALVTGHEEDGKPNAALDYAALAAFPGTLVIYMGVVSAPHWTQKLIENGKSPDTPTMVVRRCSWPDQVTFASTLGEVAAEMARRRLRPPVLVLVGDVIARNAQHGGVPESWFTRRPVFGRRVLVTRPAEQADDLASLLEEQGAEILVQPAIEILDPPDWSPVDQALARIEEFDWLVFSSANGVRKLLDRLLVTHDTRRLGGVKLAAIGSATESALRDYHLKPDRVPPIFRAESLADALVDQAQGQRYLLARASRGREILAERLTASGGIVEQIVVYTSQDIVTPDAEIAQALAQETIDWITVTSSAIAGSLASMFGESLRKAKLASISPITSERLRELGYSPSVEATEYTMEGVAQAIVAAEKEKVPGTVSLLFRRP